MISKNAKITISKGQSDGKSMFRIEVKDGSSGICIVNVEMEMEEFAECIGGLSHCSGNIKNVVSEGKIQFIGMNKETKRIGIKLPDGISSYDIKRGESKGLIDENIPDGWMLWDDGLNSQQNHHGHHNIIAYRYVENK